MLKYTLFQRHPKQISRQRKSVKDTSYVLSTATLQWSCWIGLSSLLAEERGTGGNFPFQKTHNSEFWNWDANITLTDFLVTEHCITDVSLNFPAQVTHQPRIPSIQPWVNHSGESHGRKAHLQFLKYPASCQVSLSALREWVEVLISVSRRDSGERDMEETHITEDWS